jgi:hypothetical protein
MLDNDLGGQTGTKICIKKMFPYFELFKVVYESKQPDELTKEQLQKALSSGEKVTRQDYISSKEH